MAGVSTEPVTLVVSDGWCTPKWLADALGYFDLDPCSNPRSLIHAGRTLSLENHQDGLTYPWGADESVFCNPPYSDVMPWAERLITRSLHFVALVKLDPSTRWWARLVNGALVRWAPFRKRIKFDRPGKAPLTANFPSALVWRSWTVPATLAPHLWLPERTSYDRRTL